MPLFQLPDEPLFPSPHLAEPDGLLAIGGDLSPERLLQAYAQGIFPWFSKKDPILWWSPDPRFVLFPPALKVSRSMHKILRDGIFEVSVDRDFRAVIQACQGIPREGQRGTWITPGMLEAYCQLHDQGYAHSIEVWQEGALVGGLYGISLGRSFFGESMFARVSNASKAGFIYLVHELERIGFDLIDCQVHTAHLESLGAVLIPRSTFLETLQNSLRQDTLRGNWGTFFAK
jgi:leucyl/phenylalanyl-tRNA---protein transferase